MFFFHSKKHKSNLNLFLLIIVSFLNCQNKLHCIKKRISPIDNKVNGDFQKDSACVLPGKMVYDAKWFIETAVFKFRIDFYYSSNQKQTDRKLIF